MEREWTYIDETGAEYGPYTRAELELYASQGRVSASGKVRNAAGETMTPGDAGLEIPEGRSEAERMEHPATDAVQATREAEQSRQATLSPTRGRPTCSSASWFPGSGGSRASTISS